MHRLHTLYLFFSYPGLPAGVEGWGWGRGWGRSQTGTGRVVWLLAAISHVQSTPCAITTHARMQPPPQQQQGSQMEHWYGRKVWQVWQLGA